MIDVAWWDFAALEGLRADDRLRVLSREAAAVLFRLVLVARAGGEVPYLNHHTGAQSVAVYDLRESDTTTTRDACARAVKELVDVGLVALDDAARVIRLDLHAGVLAREVQTAGADVAETGRPRRPPSQTPDAQRDRKLRYEFAHRVGRFAPSKVSIAEGATWEAWSVSVEGAAILARLNDARNNPAPCSEQPRNKARNNPEQPGTTPEQPLSPTPPLPETKGKEEREDAREPSAEQPSEQPQNKKRNKARNNPEQPRRERKPRAPVVDTVPMPGTAEREVYDAIITDSALCPITGNPGDFATRAVTGMFPHLSAREITAAIKRAALHVASNPGEYRDGRRFLLNWLRRDDEKAAARPRPASPAPAASSARPAAPVETFTDPRVSPADAAAQARAFRASLASKETTP